MAAEAQLTTVRIGRNQALFREVNERVERLRQSSYPLTEVDFICECADDGCFAPITLTIEEYEAVRAEPETFIVRPEHVYPEAEVVAARHGHYWIVQKFGSAERVVVDSDPRSDRNTA